MTDGEKMLRLAETRIGEKYVNVLVPKNNKNWHGPGTALSSCPGWCIRWVDLCMAA